MSVADPPQKQGDLSHDLGAGEPLGEDEEGDDGNDRRLGEARKGPVERENPGEGQGHGDGQDHDFQRKDSRGEKDDDKEEEGQDDDGVHRAPKRKRVDLGEFTIFSPSLLVSRERTIAFRINGKGGDCAQENDCLPDGAPVPGPLRLRLLPDASALGGQPPGAAGRGCGGGLWAGEG